MKNKIIKFRNDNKEYRKLCSVILREFDRLSKNPTDEQCIQVIKKMIEGNKLTGNVEENFILEQFLPKQLSEWQITDIIQYNDFKFIGECMSYFKHHYPTRYDGKVVSKIYNNLV